MSIYRYFASNTTSHSKTNAHLLALLSYYIYHDELPTSYSIGASPGSFKSGFSHFFKDLSACEPLDTAFFFASASSPDPFPFDTQVAVLSNSEIIIVVFRGTEGSQGSNKFFDFLTSAGPTNSYMMNAPGNWGPNVQVHKGFYKALDARYGEVRKWIKHVRSSNHPQKVFVTGHSLGGALATLCAYRLAKVDKVAVAGVYTFGAPRVGDLNFKYSYTPVLGNRTFRWVKNNDFGPKLPYQGGPAHIPSTLYHHVGILNFIHADGTVQHAKPESTPGPIPHLVYSPWDHRMDNYGLKMQSELSGKDRKDFSDPTFLVEGDLPKGLFTSGVSQLVPHVCPRGHSGNQAGAISEVAAARHRQQHVVNAVRDSEGRLKLIDWHVSPNGAITRSGDSGKQASTASSLAIAREAPGGTGPKRFVTACRGGNGDLFLISWMVSLDGTKITRLGDSGSQGDAVDTTISIVGILPWTHKQFVTAQRSNGQLLIVCWRLNDDGSLDRLASNQAGKVLDFELVSLPNRWLVTPVRAADGTLRLITWRASDTSVTRKADSGTMAGKVQDVHAAVDGFGNVITAVKDSSKNLKLISWKIATQGSGNVTRLGDSGGQAGRTEGHGISKVGDHMVTAVRGNNARLKVIAWQTTSNGKIARVGASADMAGGQVTTTTQCDELPHRTVVTSARNASGLLRLTSWRMPGHM
jgi:pimeloyl-ACP methyl ester carboxylesterase